MYKIIDNRGSGKTSRLMLLTKENNGIFVCAHPQDIKAKAKTYGLTDSDIISYHEYFLKKFDENKPVYIDELDLFVKSIQNNCLNGFTLTIGD